MAPYVNTQQCSNSKGKVKEGDDLSFLPPSPGRCVSRKGLSAIEGSWKPCVVQACALVRSVEEWQGTESALVGSEGHIR